MRNSTLSKTSPLGWTEKKKWLVLQTKAKRKLSRTKNSSLTIQSTSCSDTIVGWPLFQRLPHWDEQRRKNYWFFRRKPTGSFPVLSHDQLSQLVYSPVLHLVLQAGTSGSKNQAGTSGSIWYLQVFSGWDVKVHILIQCHEHFGKERHNSLYLLFCNCYSKSKQSLNCTDVHPSLLPRGNHLLRIFSPCFFHSKPSVCIPSCQRGQMKLLNLEERNCEIQLAENMDHSLNSVPFRLYLLM